MRARALGDEAGVTLVEVLAAVSLMGIAFTLILGGMMTSAVGADIHRKAATVDLELRSFADRIERAAYADCAGVSDYAPGQVGYAAPPGFSASVTAVAYWRTSGSDPDSGSFVGTCGTDEGTQRLSLRLASDDGRAQRVRDIVKRAP